MRYGSNSRRRSRSALLLGAGVVVFGLFAAVLWFAYADVIGLGGGGPPPLIRAEAGPYKRPPDDPGGMAIAEASPVERIIADQVEPYRRERLLPAQDLPISELPEEPLDELPLTTAVEPAPATGASGDMGPALIAPEPPATTTLAAAPAATPLAPLAAREPESPPTATAPPAGGEAMIVPAPAPRATERTASPRTVGPAQATAPRTAAVEPVRSAPAAAATFRVQLGAFRTEAAAAQAWSDLQRRNRSALGHLRPSISAAQTSSGTFFRLQAGTLGSRDAAVQTCAQLKAAGNDCFVVGPLP
jgi:cell division septation protein DedD